ncbi:MAG: hypothetical protein AMXMBFR82_52990 [Candidatus Hydrogenedentota bacterium]
MMRRLIRESDDRLVRDTLAGDQQAFARLVERYLQTAHAVAFAQTGNHADAEDSTQDAFLKVYQSLDTLRDRSRFGPWLAALTRNTAIDLVRKRQRRDKLADQLPWHEALHNMEPERRDEAELVRAKVMAMDEGPREVILLYYFAGHTLREIAQLLNISKPAAQKRLVRAREQLSESVIRALGAEPSHIHTRDARVRKVMGAIAAAPVAWDATAASAGVGASVAALAAPKTLALIALVCAGAGLALWQLVRDGEVPPPPAEVSRESDTIESPESEGIFEQLLSDVPAATHQSESVDAAPASTPQIQGHVIDETGKLMAGVKVLPRLVTMKEDGTEELARGEVQVDTGTDGAFEIDELAPGTYDVQLLVPPANVFSSKSFKRFTLAADDVVDGMQIVYDRTQGVPIFGRVVDLNGNPVSDASVSDKGGPLVMTKTNNAGEFSFIRFEEGLFNLYASHPDHGSVSLLSQEPRAEGFELVLGGQGAIEGQVVAAETGEPLTDFSIAHARGRNTEFSWGMNLKLQPTHDDDGRFSLTNVQAGDVTLISRAPGRALKFHTGERVIPGQTTSGVVITLEPGVSLEGRVVDASGAPVSGTMVFEGPIPRVSPMYYPDLAGARSDETGQFVLNDLSRATNKVSAYHEDHQPGGVVNVDLSGDAPNTVTITLGGGGAIQGRVLLGDQPLAGAHIQLLVEDGQQTGRTAAQTDAQGRYILPHLSACEGQLRADISLGPGIMNERMRFLPIVVEADETTIADFTFPVNECRVAGLLSYNGVPPQHMGISIDILGSDGVRESFIVPVETDGTYVIENVPSGTVTFSLAWEREPNTRAGWPTALEYAIAPGQTLQQDFIFEGSNPDTEQGFWDAIVAEWPSDELR